MDTPHWITSAISFIASGLEILSLYSKSSHIRAQFFQRKGSGLAKFNDLPLFAAHPSRDSRNLLRDLDRNGLDSVAVSMQQVARLHMHIADLYGASEIENVSKRMRD